MTNTAMQCKVGWLPVPVSLDSTNWQAELARLAIEQEQDLAEAEAQRWHWVDPQDEQDFETWLESQAEMEAVRHGHF